MFRKLHIYRVYVKSGADDPIETAEFVREGFSIWAMILNIFWLIWNRIWLASIVFVLLTATNIMLQLKGIISAKYSMVVDFGIAFIIAINAFDWYAGKLENNGYELYDIVSGKSLDEAQQRFFDRVAAEDRQKEQQENAIMLRDSAGW